MKNTSPIRLWATIVTLCAMQMVLAPDAIGAALPETNGAFYAISCKNIDQAIDWYTRHLGFTLTSKGGNEHRQGALLQRPGAILELAQFPGAVPRDSLKVGLASHEVFGIFKLGFLTEHLDETFESLKRAGVEIFFAVVEASDGKRTFAIKDPEGNIIQFFGT